MHTTSFACKNEPLQESNDLIVDAVGPANNRAQKWNWNCTAVEYLVQVCKKKKKKKCPSSCIGSLYINLKF